MTDWYCVRTSSVIDHGGGPIRFGDVGAVMHEGAEVLSVEMASHPEWHENRDIMGDRWAVDSVSDIKDHCDIPQDESMARRGLVQCVRDHMAADDDNIFLVDVVEMGEVDGVEWITPQEFLENHVP